jgi:hypothetical protein
MDSRGAISATEGLSRTSQDLHQHITFRPARRLRRKLQRVDSGLARHQNWHDPPLACTAGPGSARPRFRFRQPVADRFARAFRLPMRVGALLPGVARMPDQIILQEG